MKQLFFSILICLSTCLFAESNDLEGLPGYIIQSDSVDTSIPDGNLIVQGNIKMFSSALPLKGVRVGTNSNEVLSDSLGNFKLVALVTDTVFYCYKSGWSEIYEVNPSFSNQHRMTLDVYMNRRKQLMRKPVIYLYNEESLDADILLRPKGDFTFTYPEYQNGWSVTVNPNGGIIDKKTEQHFPYLFWEAKTEGLFFDFSEKQIEGWIIHSDTCIAFLEHQLTELGLNQTEQTDFITFWAPIISRSEFVMVQFLLDDSYQNRIAEMEITPKPDALRRVYLLMAPLDRPYIGLNVVPQTFTRFNREGFTVLEWGGTELDFLNLKF